MNWALGLAILALLVVMPNEQWIMSAFKLSPSLEAERVVRGLRAIAVLGLFGIPLNYVVFKWLLAIVGDGSGGFALRRCKRVPIAEHRLGAARLAASEHVHRRIAKGLSTPAHPVNIDAGFSANGWLAVLLTFVLARVFAEGARMREDREQVTSRMTCCTTGA